MLNFMENPNIASISQTNEENYEQCHYLDPTDLNLIVCPQVLSPLQEEMMSHHCHLCHTPFPKLIVGEIPKRLAQLKGCCPICVSCLFSTAHKCPRRTKSKENHPIQQEPDMITGGKASTNQIVLAQPELIPQISGQLTNQRVNGSTVFVEPLLL